MNQSANVDPILEKSTRIIHHVASLTTPPPEDLPTHVYHYTTLEGFKSIVMTNELWATHVGVLNDSEEITHAARLTRDILHGVTRPLDPAQSEFKQTVLRVLDEMIDTPSGLMGGLSAKLFNFFVVSFSADGDLLSQWRGYGSKLAPIAIEYDFTRLYGAKVHDRLQPMFQLANVVYDDQRKHLVLNTLVELILEALQGQDPSLFTFFVYTLLFHFPQFKHSSFKGENEFRYIYYRFNKPDPEGLKLDFRARDNVLLPYAHTVLDGQWPITKILVGPTVDQDATLRSVQYFVTHQQSPYNEIPVEKSKIPFRG